jgi:hypothetical protein
MKTCSRCAQGKDESCFYKAAGRCKSCDSAIRRKLRLQNRAVGLCANCTKKAVSGYLCESCQITAKRARQKFFKTEKGLRAYDRQRFGKGRFRYMRAYALKRGHSWSLTSDQYTDLVIRPCHYCGMENSSKAGIGLDRLDNDKGYELDNVVGCCGECNVARSDNFTAEEMRIIGSAIRQVKLARTVQPINRRYFDYINAREA